MKSFENQAAQGDVLITRIPSIPKDAVIAKAEGGKFVVAHSETGHHHTIVERPGVMYYTGKDPAIAYMEVIDQVEVTLKHEREFDTHESLLLKGGTYEIRRQQEYTPVGWRRVLD